MNSSSLFVVPIVALLTLSAAGVGLPEPLPDEGTIPAPSTAAAPLIADWDPEVEARMAQPVPEIETGIGPGSALRITHQGVDGAFLCTANFVWTDDFDRLYLGTAGHCLVPEDKTATHGPDADHDRNDTKVEVRSGACPVSGLGATCSVGGSSNPWVRLGAVTYAVSTGIGGDFGFIEIPEELHSEVRHTLPAWGGPTGEGSMGSGHSVLHYGQGVAYGEAFATRGRAGMGAGSGSTDWTAIGVGNPGDSGSAVISGNGPADALSGADAIGILTHGIGAGAVGAPGAFFGTNLDTAKRLTHDHTGLRIWTLPGGAPLEGLEEPEQESGENVTLERGTVVIRHENDESTTKNHTYKWDNGWNDIRLMVNLETEAGTAAVDIRDAAGDSLYTLESDGSHTVDEELHGVPQGPWTIGITFDGHMGSLALRIEPTDDDEDPDGGTDNTSGGDGPGGDPDEEPERAEPLPVPGMLALLVVCGIALLLRARRGRD